MIRIELVDPAEMPRRMDAYAIHKPSDVTFVVRSDAGSEGVAEAVNRLGETIAREAIDAETAGSPAAGEQALRMPQVPEEVPDAGEEPDEGL